MKRFLVPLVLPSLAACSQTPAADLGLGTDPTPLDFGTSQYDLANALAKHSTKVYVVGYMEGDLHTAVPKGGSDAFISKYDANGDLLWGRQFGTNHSDYATGVASYDGNNAFGVGFTTGSPGAARGLLAQRTQEDDHEYVLLDVFTELGEGSAAPETTLEPFKVVTAKWVTHGDVYVKYL